MKKKSLSISLAEKTFDPKLVGEWKGYQESELIFLELYIKKHYDDLVHIPFTHSVVLLEKRSSHTSKYFFGIENNSDPGNVYEYPPIKEDKDIFKNFFDLATDTNKRFTLVLSNEVIEYRGNTEGHSMVFLYDKKYNELEIFDSINTDYIPYKENINKFFKDLYGKKVKIIYPYLCINVGRTYMKRCKWTKKPPVYLYNSEGFCVIWSLWYLELRFKNPAKTRDQIINKAVESLRKEPDKICRFVRGYAQFVEKIIKDYTIYKDGKNVFLIVKKNSYLEIPKKLIKMFGIMGAIVYYIKSITGFL